MAAVEKVKQDEQAVTDKAERKKVRRATRKTNVGANVEFAINKEVGFDEEEVTINRGLMIKEEEEAPGTARGERENGGAETARQGLLGTAVKAQDVEVDVSDSDSEESLDAAKNVAVKKVKVEESLETLIENAKARKNTVVKITWHDLKFTAKVVQPLPKERARFCRSKEVVDLNILKGCSGSALPGQCTYIMGSSGAGKTSLLNMISDRISSKKGNDFSGKVMMNDDKVLNQDSFGDIGAYVMQDDILFSYFTVEECLQFAARLKLNDPINRQN
jgi:ABC-type multidrug transport system fused ATPase/permease subunit